MEKRYQGQRGPQKTPLKIPVSLRINKKLWQDFKKKCKSKDETLIEAIERLIRNYLKRK